MTIENAILQTLQSPSVCSRNGEYANVVDVLDGLGTAIQDVALAITPRNTGSGKDALGGTVTSLTEAVMGVSGGLVAIAHAISDLANAVREKGVTHAAD